MPPPCRSVPSGASLGPLPWRKAQRPPPHVIWKAWTHAFWGFSGFATMMEEKPYLTWKAWIHAFWGFPPLQWLTQGTPDLAWKAWIYVFWGFPGPTTTMAGPGNSRSSLEAMDSCQGTHRRHGSMPSQLNWKFPGPSIMTAVPWARCHGGKLRDPAGMPSRGSLGLLPQQGARDSYWEGKYAFPRLPQPLLPIGSAREGMNFCTEIVHFTAKFV